MKTKLSGRFSTLAAFGLIFLAVIGGSGMALPITHLEVVPPKNETERKERELVRELLKKTSGKSEEVKWTHEDSEKKGERVVKVTLKAKNDLGMEVMSTLVFTIEDGKITSVKVQ